MAPYRERSGEAGPDDPARAHRSRGVVRQSHGGTGRRSQLAPPFKERVCARWCEEDQLWGCVRTAFPRRPATSPHEHIAGRERSNRPARPSGAQQKTGRASDGDTSAWWRGRTGRFGDRLSTSPNRRAAISDRLCPGRSPVAASLRLSSSGGCMSRRYWPCSSMKSCSCPSCQCCWSPKWGPPSLQRTRRCRPWPRKR
jgi:hypothetical protein